MATLAVHEAMGAKVDREATATLVLPQLWSMSMGPRKYKYLFGYVLVRWLMRIAIVLNAEQFGKFMA